MWPLIAPALIQGGFGLFSSLMGNRAQTKLTQQSLAQQLQQFREQQQFLREQAQRDQTNWEAQQAEDTRRYNQLIGMQQAQWDAQQQLRAPYRAASQHVLNGAFGSGALGRYPGNGSLGAMMRGAA